MNEKLKELREKLIKPFSENEIEWRVQSCGISNGKPWVRVLAYVKPRPIQDRLDEVFGFNCWKDEYRGIGEDIICRLWVKVEGEWIFKENGASKTAIEGFKGGISGAFKRTSASGYGIGRYLYNLKEGFAECILEKPSSNKGWEKAKTKDNKIIYWKIPKLPKWALPTDDEARSIQQDGRTDSNENQCSDCNKEISQAEKSYSQRNFGKSLCRECQGLQQRAS